MLTFQLVRKVDVVAAHAINYAENLITCVPLADSAYVQCLGSKICLLQQVAENSVTDLMYTMIVVSQSRQVDADGKKNPRI